MPDTGSGATSEKDYRAGFVALLGPPNVGKSTLLNRLLGQKLAIVSPKPQTTRSRILGILTRPEAQLLLLDTPGRHRHASLLNESLNDTVDAAIRDCDVALVVLDAGRGLEETHVQLRKDLERAGKPYVLAASKRDLFAGPVAGATEEDQRAIWHFSGLTGEGVPELLATLVEHLPASPALYPEDDLTDRPVRWICAELIREAVFECLQRELPYSMAVEVIEFDEGRPGRIRIRADLLVERNSQKRIVVGAGGRTVKQIGIRARTALERFLATRVDLQLFVKEDAHWMRSASRLRELGYH